MSHLSSRFTGKDPEPRPSLSSGHMPNSESLPFTELLASQPATSGTSYSTLLPASELLPVVKRALGADAEAVLALEKPVTNSCGSGMTAAVLWLALKELGVDSAIYDEVWASVSNSSSVC